MKWIKNNRAWVFGAFCISAFLILFEPFGTTFRNTSALILALSYGILSMATLYVLNQTLKSVLFKKLISLKKIVIYAIWHVIVLAIIALFNFLYFGLWACHCEEEYKIALFVTEFAPRTFAIGGFLIITDRILEYFPENSGALTAFIECENKNVIAISSFGNYLKIKKIEENQLVEVIERGTLSELEKNYSSHFFRCHRSHIINTQYVRNVIKKDRRYIAILEFDVTIPVSTSKAGSLKPLVKA